LTSPPAPLQTSIPLRVFSPKEKEKGKSDFEMGVGSAYLSTD